MNSAVPFSWWRQGEYRHHPGDLPPANRIGKVAPRKPSPNKAPRNKRKRQWK